MYFWCYEKKGRGTVKVQLDADGKKIVAMGAILTKTDEVLFAEQLNLGNVTIVLVLIGAHTVATRTKASRELDVSHASFHTSSSEKRRRA